MIELIDRHGANPTNPPPTDRRTNAFTRALGEEADLFLPSRGEKKEKPAMVDHDGDREPLPASFGGRALRANRAVAATLSD